MATKEYFPGIGKIKFEGVESKNPMAFRYYDAEKVVMGKKMKEVEINSEEEQKNSRGTILKIR